jgi:hypothetical protein
LIQRREIFRGVDLCTHDQTFDWERLAKQARQADEMR